MDEDDPFETKKVLHIDADILVYKPCCIFNDDNTERTKRLLIDNIDRKIRNLCASAGVTKFRLFLTTKFNFRNYVTDDYKANRVEVDRPINLSFAKNYILNKYKAEYIKYLEADDLLSIHQTEDTIIWSPDKDLRQVEGTHLDVETEELIQIDKMGSLDQVKGKIKFTGLKGLYYQALVGDNADYILGCAERKEKVYKTGKKVGLSYTSRVGIGPKKAYKLLNELHTERELREAVGKEYIKNNKDSWKEDFEKQMNLLYMVKHLKNGKIKRWTVDDRDEYMDLSTGGIYSADEG